MPLVGRCTAFKSARNIVRLLQGKRLLIHIARKEFMPVHIVSFRLLHRESLFLSKILRSHGICPEAVVMMVRLVVRLKVLLQEGKAVLLKYNSMVILS